jgi:hypothetical protein
VAELIEDGLELKAPKFILRALKKGGKRLKSQRYLSAPTAMSAPLRKKGPFGQQRRRKN